MISCGALRTGQFNWKTWPLTENAPPYRRHFRVETGTHFPRLQSLLRMRYTVMSIIRPMSLRTIWANKVASPNESRVLIPTQKGLYREHLNQDAAMHALFAYCWSVMARLHPQSKEMYYPNALEHESRRTSVLRPLLANLSRTKENLDIALQTVVLLCSAAVFRS